MRPRTQDDQKKGSKRKEKEKKDDERVRGGALATVSQGGCHDSDGGRIHLGGTHLEEKVQGVLQLAALQAADASAAHVVAQGVVPLRVLLLGQVHGLVEVDGSPARQGAKPRRRSYRRIKERVV